MTRGLAEQSRAGDGAQRPLVPRSRFPPRLTRSVRCQSVASCLGLIKADELSRCAAAFSRQLFSIQLLQFIPD